MTTYTVSSGTGTDGVTLGASDTMTVLHGGTSIYTTANGPYPNGSQDVFGETIGTTINASALEIVESGGVAYASVVDTEGLLNVSSGGFASGTIVHNGGFVQNGGVMAATVISNGGGVYNDGSMRGTVLNGGSVSQQGSAVTSGTLIHAGGEEIAYNGYAPTGGLYGSVVDSGGVQYLDGAIAYNTTVRVGGVMSVTGGNIIETEYLEGFSKNAVISSGGLEIVAGQIIPGQIWAESDATTVLNGGQESVWLGGEANGTVVDAGGHLAVDGIASASVLSGGTLWDNTGGTTVGTMVKSGGTEIVYSGGVASATTVFAGGFETISRGLATGTVVMNGGFEGVFNGTTSGTLVLNGGKEVIYTGGVDQFSTINAGMEFIRSGGIVSGGLISGTGTLTVASGGTAVGNLTIQGGTVVDQGAIGIGASINFVGSGGKLVTTSGGLTPFAATISGFTKGDTIDTTNFPYLSNSSTHFTYSAGTLTLTNGSAHVSYKFAGSYTASSFSISNDGSAAGTLIKHT